MQLHQIGERGHGRNVHYFVSPEALRLVNNHEGALLGLGVAYKSLGQEGVAIDYFNKVVAIGKDSEMAKMNQKLQGAYYYLGEVYLKRGERDQAIEQLKNSIALNPADADALYLLGRAYQEGNAYEEATTYYSQAVAYVPNFLEAYEGMRQCYQKLGNKPLAAYAQGMLELFSGRYQEARQQLEAALAAESDIANAFWGLGYAYERTGQVRQAKDAYEKALGVDPNHILAKSAISRLDRVFPNSG
jgi:tetratricopeptide (TPR) repeat protein